MKKLSALVLAGALVLGACGDDDEAPVVADETDETTTTTAAVDGPARIVSLSPSATETLFAVGAGDQVVAVDAQSDYPEGVPTTDLSAYEPNVEAIASYEPDLVVMSDDEELQASLEALDIDVLVSPAPTTIEADLSEPDSSEAFGAVETTRATRSASSGCGVISRQVAGAPSTADATHE